jgi:hypothetical protein
MLHQKHYAAGVVAERSSWAATSIPMISSSTRTCPRSSRYARRQRISENGPDNIALSGRFRFPLQPDGSRPHQRYATNHVVSKSLLSLCRFLPGISSNSTVRLRTLRACQNWAPNLRSESQVSRAPRRTAAPSAEAKPVADRTWKPRAFDGVQSATRELPFPAVKPISRSI